MSTPPGFASQHADTLPWIPLGPGQSFKPLRFFAHGRGRVLLLRLEPGTVVPRRRPFRAEALEVIAARAAQPPEAARSIRERGIDPREALDNKLAHAIDARR